MYQSKAEINLAHLIENYYNIKSIVGDAKIMAVVKANAYGHGAKSITKTLSNHGIYGFCVALASEITELIRTGLKKPILHLGRIHKKYIELYSIDQVLPTINSIDDIAMLDYFHKGREPIRSHLKIDTGMGRMGVKLDEAEKVMNSLHRNSKIKIEGIYSHFATADDKNTEYINWQLKNFIKIKKISNNILPDVKYFHIANSASILTCPDSHFNMVRPGLSLYGVSPLGIPHKSLKPVMTMKAPVVMV